MTLADDLREALIIPEKTECSFVRCISTLDAEERALIENFIEACREWRATKGRKAGGGPSALKLYGILKKYKLGIGESAISGHIEGTCRCVAE